MVLIKDESDNDEMVVFNQSQHYTLDEFCQIECLKENFAILSLNTRSLLDKLDELQVLLSDIETATNFTFDVITIQETWLDDSTENLINIPGYNFICKNKKPTKRGGGLGIFIKEYHDFKIRKDLFDLQENNEFDGLFIEIINSCKFRKNIVIGVLYRSPSFDSENEFCNTINNSVNKLKQDNIECIITGDMNIDLLKHESQTSVASYLDTFISNSYFPQITLPTRISKTSSTLIDHIFKKISTCDTLSGSIIHDISDHYPSFTILKNIQNKVTYPHTIAYREINETNLNNFNDSLSTVDWTPVLSKVTSNDAYETFLNIYKELMNIHMPIKTKRFKKYNYKLTPWITTGILKSIRTRNNLYKKFVKLKDKKAKSIAETKYKTYRNLLSKIIKNTKQDFWLKRFHEAKYDVKSTWRNINEKLNITKKSHNFPETFLKNGTAVNGSKNIANAFNNYFVNVGPNLANNIKNINATSAESYLNKQNINSIFLRPTDQNEILKIISEMKNKHSSGYDDISSTVLKRTYKYILVPLQHIINTSIEKGLFPNKMKIAKIVPIHKAKKKNYFNNYRPISLLPTFSKILEKNIYLTDYLASLIKTIFFTSLNMDFKRAIQQNMLFLRCKTAL